MLVSIILILMDDVLPVVLVELPFHRMMIYNYFLHAGLPAMVDYSNI
jgi:hypothetical protein